jgi:predicted ArsR family transcriptional regulator
MDLLYLFHKNVTIKAEMPGTKLDKRFFESTRGRIVALMRGSTKTVNELATDLGLTDNAVRAHLVSLERDGLIRQSGVQPGTRKPHFAYQLTDEAESLFPRAYDSVLNQLIAVLKKRLSSRVLKGVVRELGRSLAGPQPALQGKSDLQSRAQRGLEALEKIGGAARLEKQGQSLFIKSGNCPLANSVSEHPEVCQAAESMLAEVTGAKVRERCNREGSPQCMFEMSEAEE